MDEKLHHPFPDYESAVKRGNIDGKTGGVKILPPEEVAWRRNKVEPKEELVFVRGHDTELPDPDLKKALTKHFSSCGEIPQVIIPPKHSTDQVVCMRILGEDVKEKVEQLNGSDMGGFKLAVKVPVLPPNLPSSRPRSPVLVGYVLPESTRRMLELKRIRREARSEKRFKQRIEKEMKKLSLNNKENQAKNKMKHSSKKQKKKKKKENEAL